MLDLKIINGMVIDGSGEKGYLADIGIIKDKIVMIGDLKEEEAQKVIDAKGKYIAPGFIDFHTHSDLSLIYDVYARSRIYSGVTTEVIGNCGIGPAPIREEKKQMLIDYLGTRIIGTIPAKLVLHWNTFKEYLAFIEDNPPAVNVAPLLAHGAIRIDEMGFSKEDANEEQLENMKKEVAKAMEEGAIAMSSGLIYLPGAYTKKEELAELCKALKPYGGYYCTHMRNEGDFIFEAIEEAIEIAKTAEVPLHISHLKLFGKDNFGQTDKLFAVLEKAEKEGLEITYDAYPYCSGMSSLGALVPPWLFEGGVDKMVERLQEKENRKKAVYDILHGYQNWQNPLKATGSWDKVWIASVMKEENKWMEGLSFTEISKKEGKDPYDVLFDTIISEKAKVQVVTEMMSQEDVDRILTNPKTMVGSDSMSLSTEGLLSIGKPHPRAFGTFGRMFSYYVREKGLLSFEEVVKKMTSLSAKRLGLKDRGLLKMGYFADIVIFDPEIIGDTATYKEPKSYPSGIETVIVNGRVALENGEQKNVLAGRVLRSTNRNRK